MLAPEVRLADLDIFYRLTKPSRKGHRDREPLKSCGCFDPVSLLPGPFLKLHTVEKDKSINLVDQVEIAEPRQVSRLRDGNFHLPPSVSTKRSVTLRNPSDFHSSAAAVLPSATSNWILDGANACNSRMACRAQALATPLRRWADAT